MGFVRENIEWHVPLNYIIAGMRFEKEIGIILSKIDIIAISFSKS